MSKSPEKTVSEGISRRDHVLNALEEAGMILIPDLPDWIETIEDTEFENLIEVCRELFETEIIEADQLLDILETGLDLGDSIGLIYSFLLTNGENPDEVLSQYNVLF